MTSLNQSNIAINHQPGFLENLAQTQLEKRLNKIPHGVLVIEDGPESKSFGNKTLPTDVSAKIVIHDPALIVTSRLAARSVVPKLLCSANGLPQILSTWFD